MIKTLFSLKKLIGLFALLSSLIMLTSCGGGGGYDGHYKVGKPYKIKNKWYYPHEDPTYNKVGIASWYGPGFHGKLTANGEKYNQNDMTAAHPTLPLPSIVKVTNLRNGKTVKLRVNDRGPFARNRIIDISKEGAKKLGFYKQGTTRVRVKYLPKETDRLLADLGLRRKASSRRYASTSRQRPVTETRTFLPTPAIGKDEYHAYLASKHYKIEQPYNLDTEDVAPVVSVLSTSLDILEETVEVANVATPVIRKYQQFDNPYTATTTVSNALIKIPTLRPHKYLTYNPSNVINQLASANTIPSATAKYIIQAGAFNHPLNAQDVALKLGRIASASIDPVASSSGEVYEVNVGPVANSHEAKKLLDRIIKLGYNAAVIRSF